MHAKEWTAAKFQLAILTQGPLRHQLIKTVPHKIANNPKKGSIYMQRRTLMTAAGASLVSPLAGPSTVRAQSASTLRFTPQQDLVTLDPVTATAYISRNHGYMVFDTLYGMDGNYQATPQMVDGHTIENDGRLWNLTLREGLLWHDGEKVLARDCVASIRRWARRDPFGATLLDVTDELAAPDDRTIRFRLKRPFPLLPIALGKASVPVCAMMPRAPGQHRCVSPGIRDDRKRPLSLQGG